MDIRCPPHTLQIFSEWSGALLILVIPLPLLRRISIHVYSCIDLRVLCVETCVMGNEIVGLGGLSLFS